MSRARRGLGLAGLWLCVITLPAAEPEPLSYWTQTLEVGGRRHQVRLPRGLRLEVLAQDLAAPRMPAFGPEGDLFLGSRSGTVYRLRAPYYRASPLVETGDYPHSVAFRPGEILIARTGGLYRAPYRAGQERVPPSSLQLLAALPGGGGHSSRTVRVGPDGRIYVSLGISGNCSDEYLGPGYPFERQRGGVLVLHEAPGGARWEPYASGLRNPVGLDWQPGGNGALYASNNGPDHHGYEQPPEYFSRLEPESFHGMPWFQYDGRMLVRDRCVDSGPPRPREEVSLPEVTFPARNAPMGVAFLPEGGLLAGLAGDAVVALHGSWGTRPRGGFFGDPATRRPPKLVVVRFRAGHAVRVDDLVTGFQDARGRRWARPVGVAAGPDGALYFTSDAGAEGLFRVRRAVPDGNNRERR